MGQCWPYHIASESKKQPKMVAHISLKVAWSMKPCIAMAIELTQTDVPKWSTTCYKGCKYHWGSLPKKPPDSNLIKMNKHFSNLSPSRFISNFRQLGLSPHWSEQDVVLVQGIMGRCQLKGGVSQTGDCGQDIGCIGVGGPLTKGC